MTTTPSSTERDQRLECILADYLHALEAGTPPDRAEMLARHPDLAADLASFFHNRDAMERMARPIKQQLPGPETMDPPGVPSGGVGAVVRYFGDYELLEEIARGGMGVVYRARQVSLDRVVAVKMILAGQLASAADVARFIAEATAAGKLDHPNIVPIYEVGEHEGQHYFSMKLVEGGSLAVRGAGCEGRRASREQHRQAEALLATVSRAVHHAHQRGILHRDLKPGNILIDAQGRPHVTDFGLARRVDGDSRLTQSGAIVGTPSYMAPEQARSEKVLTTGVDVYSLGAILYELLTGCPPFRAETPLDTLLQVLEREPPSPRSIHPKIDRDLETICLKCLHKQPEGRDASAAALADDLERWLRREPIEARRSSLRERVVKWARRRPAVAALLVISVFSLLTLSIGGVWYNTRLQRSLESSRRHLYAAHMSEALDAWRHDDMPRLMELLDAHRPQPGQEDLRGFEWYYLWRLCHRDRFTVPAHHGTVAAVAVSADSTTIATGAADGMVMLLDAATGKELAVLPGGPAPFRGTRSITGMSLRDVFSLGFAADGSTLTGIAGEAPGHVRRWDARARQEQGEITKISAATLSPDGTLLAWGDTNGPIHLVDTVGGHELRELQGHKKKIIALAFSPDGQVLASASEDKTVQLWNPASGERGESLIGYEYRGRALAVAPRGRAVALAGGGGILLWYPDSGQKRVIACAPTPYAGLAFAPDGRTLAIGMMDLFRLQIPQRFSNDKKSSHGPSLSVSDDRLTTKSYAEFLKVVDLATGQERLLRGHTGGISCLAFSPDSRLLATASDDMSVRLWDPDTGKEQFVFRGHVDGVSALSFARDGSFLVTGSQDGSVKRWDLAAIRETNILTGNGWILALAFSPDGTKLASASTGKGGANITLSGEVKLWDVASGQESATLPAEGWAVSEVEFFTNGSTLATCTEAARNALVTLWDVSTRQVKAKWPTQRGVALRFLGDGKTLATCDRQADDGLKLWDLATQQERAILKDENRNRCLALAPDGITLAAGDWNKGQVELWDMSTQKRVRALGTGWNEGWVSSFYDFMGNSSVAFSPDGRSVAHASRTAGIIGRGTVRLLDVSSGRERLTLQGHKAEVWSVAFARDGKTLVSGSDDHTIKFWDPVSGDQRLTLRGHEARISTVAFSPDGTTLATASWDGTVRLWRAATKNEVDARSEFAK